ncbi:MAG: hypothetical protein K0S14_614, partial [Thermomicrobiales bacterium]|nr:hypothetical protein [Thermomicrobiales bacterium]
HCRAPAWCGATGAAGCRTTATSGAGRRTRRHLRIRAGRGGDWRGARPLGSAVQRHRAQPCHRARSATSGHRCVVRRCGLARRAGERGGADGAHRRGDDTGFVSHRGGDPERACAEPRHPRHRPRSRHRRRRRALREGSRRGRPARVRSRSRVRAPGAGLARDRFVPNRRSGKREAAGSRRVLPRPTASRTQTPSPSRTCPALEAGFVFVAAVRSRCVGRWSVDILVPRKFGKFGKFDDGPTADSRSPITQSPNHPTPISLDSLHLRQAWCVIPGGTAVARCGGTDCRST